MLRRAAGLLAAAAHAGGRDARSTTVTMQAMLHQVAWSKPDRAGHAASFARTFQLLCRTRPSRAPAPCQSAAMRVLSSVLAVLRSAPLSRCHSPAPAVVPSWAEPFHGTKLRRAVPDAAPGESYLLRPASCRPEPRRVAPNRAEPPQLS